MTNTKYVVLINYVSIVFILSVDQILCNVIKFYTILHIQMASDFPFIFQEFLSSISRGSFDKQWRPSPEYQNKVSRKR